MDVCRHLLSSAVAMTSQECIVVFKYQTVAWYLLGALGMCSSREEVLMVGLFAVA